MNGAARNLHAAARRRPQFKLAHINIGNIYAHLESELSFCASRQDFALFQLLHDDWIQTFMVEANIREHNRKYVRRYIQCATDNKVTPPEFRNYYKNTVARLYNIIPGVASFKNSLELDADKIMSSSGSARHDAPRNLMFRNFMIRFTRPYDDGPEITREHVGLYELTIRIDNPRPDLMRQPAQLLPECRRMYAALLMDPQQRIAFTISIESTAFKGMDGPQSINQAAVNAELRRLLDQLNTIPTNDTMNLRQNLDDPFYLNLFWHALRDSKFAAPLPYKLLMRSVVRQLSIDKWNDALSRSSPAEPGIDAETQFWISHKPDGILTIGAVLTDAARGPGPMLLLSKVFARIFTGDGWISGLRALYESGLMAVLTEPASLHFIFNAELVLAPSTEAADVLVGLGAP